MENMLIKSGIQSLLREILIKPYEFLDTGAYRQPHPLVLSHECIPAPLQPALEARPIVDVAFRGWPNAY